MKIKYELLHIASHVPGIHTAIYAADFEANFRNTIKGVNDVDFPFLQVQDFQIGTLTRNPANGLYKTTWNVGAFLTVPTEFDFNTNDNQDLIDCQVMPLMKQFIDAINRTDKFLPLENVALRAQHGKYDYWVTGVLALFSLTERVGTPIC